MKSVIISVAAVFMLSACAQNGGFGGLGGYGQPQANKSTLGGILGGIGGAVAGSQFGKGKGQIAAAAAGTLLGAFLGSEIGQSLDQQDAMMAQQSAGYAFNTGQQATWRNPQTGHYGTVTPTRTVPATNDGTCREYSQTINVSGRQQQAYGTACQQPDGSWRIIN